MHNLSLVYFVNEPLRVSGIFVAHHQKVYCIYTTIGKCCVFHLTVCWPAGSQLNTDLQTVSKTGSPPKEDKDFYHKNNWQRFFMVISQYTLQLLNNNNNRFLNYEYSSHVLLQNF
jgi:hypothetical protein